MTTEEGNLWTPLVSVITPSYNVARYIEETIQSVLSQDYPRVEYIVIDGGSTDGTGEIIDRYKGSLRYHSAPDEGTADAINKGFRLASGEIFAWLSADDTYLAGTITTVVAAFRDDSTVGVVYGEGLWTDSSGCVLGRYPTSPKATLELDAECPICQPTVFMRRTALEQVGPLDNSLSSAFDYDLWVRLASRTRFKHVDRELATSRMHRHNKTLGQRKAALAEAMRVQKKSFGYVPLPSVYAYSWWLIERTVRFPGPAEPSWPSFAMALPAGLWINASAPFRYAREWTATLLTGVSRRVRRLFL